MTAKEKPRIPLPKDWTGNVRSAVLHVISLAQYATAYTRSWAANSPNERMRLKTENDRLESEVALLKEEIRIKDARLLSFGILASARSIRRPNGWRFWNYALHGVGQGENGRFLPSHTGHDHHVDASSG